MRVQDFIGPRRLLNRPLAQIARTAVVRRNLFDRLDGAVVPSTSSTSASDLPSLDFSKVPVLKQIKNACGTTSLAMIMEFLTGKPIDPARIDAAIRRTNNTGTAPSHLAEFARDNGLEAGMYNNSTLEELMGHVEAGRPVMVSLDKRDNNVMNVKDHYVIVTGFERDPAGKLLVQIRDPKGQQTTMSIDAFMDQWGKTADGYNNFMTVFAPGGTHLPADRLDGVEHSIAIAAAGRDLLNNADRLVSPDSVGSWVHGLIGGVGALPGAVDTGVGWLISTGGKALVDAARDWPPGLSHAGRFLGHLIDAPGRLFTGVGSTVSGTFDRLGQAFENVFHGDFKGFGKSLLDAGEFLVGGAFNTVKGTMESVKDAGGAIVDGVKDAGKAIGKGVKSAAKKVAGWLGF